MKTNPIEIKFKKVKGEWPGYMGRNGFANASGLVLSQPFHLNGQDVRALQPINGRGDTSESMIFYIPETAIQALLLALRPPPFISIHVEGGVVQGVASDEDGVKVCLIDEDNIKAGDKRPNLNRASSYDFPVNYLPTPRKQ